MSKVEQGTELSRLLLLASSIYHLMSQFSPPFDSKQASSSSSATPLGDQLFKTGLFIWHAGVLTLGSSLNACCSLLFIDCSTIRRVAIKDGSIFLLSQFILPNQVSN